ncbi:MAG: four helix bundle suffix domain-containing protein [Prevotella sp.]
MKNKKEKVVGFLRNQVKWEDLYFYQKADTLYQLSYIFAHRYYVNGDRTRDQLIQAARSGKQNIVEGSADGVTSMELEVKLLNVARSSIKEAREDFEDYLTAHQLAKWTVGHPRYDGLLSFCRQHNKWQEYECFVRKCNDEEMANVGLTLCHMIDKMMITYQKKLEATFVTEGGIKERMTAARLGYRTNQKDEIARLEAEVERLRKENDLLRTGR